jgi:hypothetical protein
MTASRASPRIADQLQILALLGGEFGIQGQLRHAQDAVHGRADFMAHIRQEFALGAAGAFGGLFGGAQLGDVRAHSQDVAHLAVRIEQRALDQLQPADIARRGG